MSRLRGISRRLWPVVLIAALLLAAAIAGCARGPAPTDEAELDLCKALAEYEAALAPIGDITEGSTIDDLKAARDAAADAWGEVEKAAQEYSDAKIRDLDDARRELDRAVSDLPDDATISEAAAVVKDEMDAVREARLAMNTGPDCG